MPPPGRCVYALTSDALFGTGVEFRGVQYKKGTYVALHDDMRAVEIHGMSLQRPCTWRRAGGTLALLQMGPTLRREPMRLVREGTNSIWLLP